MSTLYPRLRRGRDVGPYIHFAKPRYLLHPSLLSGAGLRQAQSSKSPAYPLFTEKNGESPEYFYIMSPELLLI